MDSAVPYVVTNICALFFVAYIASTRKAGYVESSARHADVGRAALDAAIDAQRKLEKDAEDVRVKAMEAAATADAEKRLRDEEKKPGGIPAPEEEAEEEEGGGHDPGPTPFQDEDDSVIDDDTEFAQFLADMAALPLNWPENLVGDANSIKAQIGAWGDAKHVVIRNARLRHISKLLAACGPSRSIPGPVFTPKRLAVFSWLRKEAINALLPAISHVMLGYQEFALLQGAIASPPNNGTRIVACLAAIDRLPKGLDLLATDRRNLETMYLLTEAFKVGENAPEPDSMVSFLGSWVDGMATHLNTKQTIDTGFVGLFDRPDDIGRSPETQLDNFYHDFCRTSRTKLDSETQLSTQANFMGKGVPAVLQSISEIDFGPASNTNLKAWITKHKMTKFFEISTVNYPTSLTSNLNRALLYCWNSVNQRKQLQRTLSDMVK